MKTIPLALATAALLSAVPASADGIVDNVNGMTLDADGKVVHFRAILVGKDGRVVRLIPVGEPEPAPPKVERRRKDRDQAPPAPRYDWRADMKGRVILPGFVDAHGHVMGLGLGALTLDLADATSLADAQSRIRAYAAANPDRPWIVGRGWNQEAWKLGRFPTAAELDAAAGNRPVWLVRADGHAGWASTAAMREAGVTAATVSPAGGRIEKTGAAPSGVFVDSAMTLVGKVVPQPSAKDQVAAFLKAQELLLAQGITAVGDMAVNMDGWMTYRRMGDVGGLRVRLMVYGNGVDETIRIGGVGPSPWLYDGKLKLTGVKLYADGALGSRGAWLIDPYADAPGQRGLGFHTDAQLQNLMSRAAMDGYQVAVHAIGDRANDQVLDAIDELSQTYKGDRRWRVEHAQVLTQKDVARFARNGVVASMQPTHETSDREMAEARLGPARLPGAYAWRSVEGTGATLAFGSDFPVERPEPFAGWAAAFTRQGPDGQPAGGWQPQERVTREEAWKAFTQGGAYAGFAENQFGRLAPGQFADFIVVDRDPLLASPADLRATVVQETWVGGAKVYTRR
jgi:predicted amidohydrolase YtcJ